MAAAWMHAWRQWHARRGALAGLAVMIALGVATSLTALAAARRTASVVDRFVAADRTGNVIVDLGSAPTSTVAQMRRLPHVAEVGLVANTEAFPEHAQGYVPMLASIDGVVGFDMQRGVLVEGRRADPRRPDDVMLSEQHARQLGKHAGDPIVLRTFTKAEAERCLLAEQPGPGCDAVFKSPGGPKIDARVVGVLRTGVDLRNRDNEVSLSFLTPAFHQAHPTLAADYLALVRLDAHARPSDFVRAATRILPASAGASFQTQNAAPVADAADVLALGFLIFGLVAGLAATIAVAQALTRQAATDGEDGAVFRALGATRAGRVATAAFGLAPAIVTGVAVGLLAAYLASATMPIGIARRAEPHPGRQFDVLVLGGGALVIVAGLVALSVTAAWLTDRRITGARPARTRYLKVPTGNAASRAVGLRYAFVTGRGTVPSHTAMAAIAAATAGVVAVIAFGASLNHLVDTPSLYGWTFDAVGIPADRSDVVRADPGVASVAQVRAQLSLQIGGDPVNGYAIRPIEGDVDEPIVRGRAPHSLDEVALGADTMSHAGVGIGDRVSIGGQNTERKMRVVGQAVFLTDQDAYPLADGALVSFDAAEKLGSPDSFDTLGITFGPGDHHATEQRLSKLAPDDFARPRPPAEVEKLEQVRRLPEFLAAFMVLLGVVAVAHAMVVSVRRNRRDLGVLRALGFRRRDVGLTVTWQAIALAVVGVVVGVPTGVFIGRWLWRAIADGIGIRAVPDVPLIALALVLPAAVAVAVVAALFPAWRAARMHPTDLLRSE